jgi:hypothetical protein
VGITKAETEFEEHLKNDLAMYNLTMQALCHIANNVTRFNELNSKYGFKKIEHKRLVGKIWGSHENQDDDDTGNQIVIIPNLLTKDSKEKFEDILCTFQKRLSYMKKFQWAVTDKDKYEELVNQMREMNDGLRSSLPRVAQSLLARELVADQPNNLPGLRGIKSMGTASAHFTDYYNAALFKKRALEQAGLEREFLEGRKPVLSNALMEHMRLDPSSIEKAEQNLSRVLRVQAGKLNQKVLVEYKMLQASETATGGTTVLFKRLVNLMDLLSLTPKPTQYRILDCKGFVRHDLGSNERYGLVFDLPPRLANQPHLRMSTLQELLRAERDNTAPKDFPLNHRFRLASRLANSVAYMHFAGWLHRDLSSDSILCFHTEEKKSVTEPFLSGFAFSRPDNPREVSEYDVTTTSNLYRQPDYQMPKPSRKFKRSDDIYSFGLVLVEIGLWKRIRAFWNAGLDPTYFKEHMINHIVPLLEFYMGQEYKEATLACLDVHKLELHGDDRKLSSEFSRQVVQRLERCELN